MTPRSSATAARARSLWSGTLTFGLVSVPVSLFPANRTTSVSLRMLSPKNHPLSRRYVCPRDGREVPPRHIVRGYELEDGEFVLVRDEDLEALAPEKSRDIDVLRFVAREAIDPIYYDRAYFLAPGSDSTKAYRLLARTMEQESKAGIATFVMRGKEYLVAILAENGILRAETLRFQDEVRSPEELDLPALEHAEPRRVRALEKAIDALSARDLDEDELRDEHARALRALAERKRKKGEDVVQPSEPDDRGQTQVIDLMEVLKRSLAGGSKGAGSRRPPGRAGRGGGRSEPSPSGGALGELSKAQLYERAKRLDIPGRSSMSKSELLQAVRSA